MTPTNPYSEELLVEQPAVELLAELGWAKSLGPGGNLRGRWRQPGASQPQ